MARTKPTARTSTGGKASYWFSGHPSAVDFSCFSWWRHQLCWRQRQQQQPPLLFRWRLMHAPPSLLPTPPTSFSRRRPGTPLDNSRWTSLQPPMQPLYGLLRLLAQDGIGRRLPRVTDNPLTHLHCRAHTPARFALHAPHRQHLAATRACLQRKLTNWDTHRWYDGLSTAWRNETSYRGWPNRLGYQVINSLSLCFVIPGSLTLLSDVCDAGHETLRGVTWYSYQTHWWCHHGIYLWTDYWTATETLPTVTLFGRRTVSGLPDTNFNCARDKTRYYRPHWPITATPRTFDATMTFDIVPTATDADIRWDVAGLLLQPRSQSSNKNWPVNNNSNNNTN